MSFAFLDGAIEEMEQAEAKAKAVRQLEELRLKAENDRRIKEQAALRVLQASSEYLLNACDATTAASAFTMKGFSDAVTDLIALGELCGKGEMDLIHKAIVARPELFYFLALRRYFRQTQDMEVGTLYLERFLTIPETKEEISHDNFIVGATKAALVIAAENYSGKPEMLKKFAKLILNRFPGIPGGEFHGFRGLLSGVARTGILKEAVSVPSSKSGKPDYHNNKPKAVPGSKIPDAKYVQKTAAAERVQLTVLPGVTAKLGDFNANNAAARARNNKKKKVA